MPNYFEFAYVNLTHGYIYLFANYFIALGVPIALGEVKLESGVKGILIFILEMIICLVVMELFAALYFTIFNSDTYVPFTCGLIVSVLYSLIRCKTGVAVRLMRVSVYMGLSCLALSVTMSMGALLGRPYYYLQWILILLNGIIIFSVAFLIKFFSVKDEMPCNIFFVTATVVTGVLCFGFAIFRRGTAIDPAASIALCLILIFVYLLEYFVMCYLVRKSYQDGYSRTSVIMRNADKDAFRLSNENLENLRKLRHEIKNHYAIMKTFIDAENYEKLKEYFSKYSDIIENSVVYSDCGNGTMNAILEIGRGRIKKIGADFEYKVTVPTKLNVNDIDLCSCIMNLVNNAVEYYERNNAVENKKVILEVFIVNRALFVKVSNPILPEHRERALTLKTSKKDAKLHGYGSKIVVGIANKYNGSVSYEVVNDMFVACVMLFVE